VGIADSAVPLPLAEGPLGGSAASAHLAPRPSVPRSGPAISRRRADSTPYSRADEPTRRRTAAPMSRLGVVRARRTRAASARERPPCVSECGGPAPTVPDRPGQGLVRRDRSGTDDLDSVTADN